jgi:mannose-6-phosphate isomerase-like protein (cupin superfamily)
MSRSFVNDSPAKCLTLAADADDADGGARRLAGRHFDIEFVRLAVHEAVSRGGEAAAAEEVSAVLEGRLRVRSGDEEYVLRAGEGIIIPPGQGSHWIGLEEGGLLYRVLVRSPATADDAG